MPVDEVSKKLGYFSEFLHYRENMVKCLVSYVTNRMADIILQTISVKHKIVNFEKHF